MTVVAFLVDTFTLKSDNNMKTVRQCPFVVNQSLKLMEDADTELSGVGLTDGELSGKVASIDDSSGTGPVVLSMSTDTRFDAAVTTSPVSRAHPHYRCSQQPWH